MMSKFAIFCSKMAVTVYDINGKTPFDTTNKIPWRGFFISLNNMHALVKIINYYVLISDLHISS